MLYQRGRVWHYEFVYNGKRYRKSTRQTNKRKAEEIERQARDRLTLGGTSVTEASVSDAAISWWTRHGQHLKSANTVAMRMEILRRCLDFDLPWSAVTAGTIADAMARRRGATTHNGRLPTPSTVNRDIIDTLRPIYNHARLVMEQPVRPIDWKRLRLKEPPERHRDLTGVEIAEAMKHLPAHYHPLVNFLRRYGPRLREAFFPLHAFDREAGRIMLRHRKDGRTHILPLLEEDRRDLAARATRAERAGLDTVWFRETREGLEPIRPNAYQWAMRKAFRKAGITDARPAHEWRHHAGTEFLRNTGNLRAAQRLLGHTSIQTTARYAHASDGDVIEGLKEGRRRAKSPTKQNDKRSNN